MSATQHRVRRQSLGGLPFLVRLLTLALLVGGLIGGIANFLLLPGFWPWEISPLAHRFLAGAAAAYVVGALITLTRSRWAESELLLVTVIIYAIPLVGAILMQPTLIDWSKVVARLFVGIVTPAIIISIGYVWGLRQHDLVISALSSSKGGHGGDVEERCGRGST